MNENIYKLWSENNIGNSILTQKGYSKKIKKKTYNSIKTLGIVKNVMDGFMTEGLERTQESRLSVNVNYTDVFHYLLKKKTFNPATYLLELTKRFSEQSNETGNKLNGYLARGIRTLASFIREQDFKIKILTVLKKKDKHAKAKFDPIKDVKSHIDISIIYKNKEYYLWLYQYSFNGLPHDMERVAGKRGELPKGKHILCPFDKTYGDYLIYAEKRLEKLNSMIKSLTKEINAIINKKTINYKNKTNRLKNYKSEIVEITKQKDDSRVFAEEVCGWYFYSLNYVEQISTLITNRHKPDKYTNVKRIMNGPDKYLSQPRIFIK